VSGGFDNEVARQTLQHRSAPVRSWTIRLLGDVPDVTRRAAGVSPLIYPEADASGSPTLPRVRSVSPAIQSRLVELAKTEPSPVVRSQLACTSKRLPPDKALPIVWQLLLREEDRKDPHIPLLLWWALESKAVSAQSQVLEMFTASDAWKAPMVRDVILSRLMRRYAAEADADSLNACVRLVATAPNNADRDRMIASLDEGLGGRQAGSIPAAFRKMVTELVDTNSTTDVHRLRLAVRFGIAGAHERVIRIATDRKMPTATRVSMVAVLNQLGRPDSVPALLSLLEWDEQHDVEVATVKAVARFDDQRVPARVLKEYPRFSNKLKSLCRQTLFTRRDWTLAFLGRVDEGQFDPKIVSIEELRGLEVYGDDGINALVRKHWGKITRGTPEEKLADVRRFNNDLRAFPGNASDGFAIFKEHCGKCHKLFGEGEEIGPDLTTANRKDRQYMLTSTVDPSSFIRREYLSVQVITVDGRILTGLVTKETPSAITLVNPQCEYTTIPRDDIDEMVPSQISQMPEDLLKPLKPQQLRDLFSYLESTPK